MESNETKSTKVILLSESDIALSEIRTSFCDDPRAQMNSDLRESGLLFWPVSTRYDTDCNPRCTRPLLLVNFRAFLTRRWNGSPSSVSGKGTGT